MNHVQVKLGSRKDLGYLIWQVSKSWGRLKQRVLNDFDVTGPQMEMLGAIYGLSLEKKEIKQVDVSQAIHMGPMTASSILRNLEKKKLIIRKLSEFDTRARVIELTDSGIDLFVEAYTEGKKIQDLVYREFDQDRLISGLNSLLNILERLNKNTN